MVFFPRYCYLSYELCFDSLLILVNKTAPLLIYGAKKKCTFDTVFTQTKLFL